MKVTIEITGADKLKRDLSKAPKEITDEWEKILLSEMGRGVNRMRSFHRAAPVTSSAGSSPGRTIRRSGFLQMAYSQVILGKSIGNVSGAMGMVNPQGANPEYLKVHEKPVDQTTTITPKRRTYLTIPFPEIRSRDGSYRSPFQFSDTFVRRSKFNPEDLIMYQRLGSGKARRLFLLKKKVVIHGRPAVRPSYEHIKPKLRDRLLRGSRAALARL